MKVDTMAPLVDTQPAYEALAEFKDQRDLYDKNTKAFLKTKLKRTVEQLRETATYLEEALKDA